MKTMIHFRADDATKAKITALCEATGMTESALMRQLVELAYATPLPEPKQVVTLAR